MFKLIDFLLFTKRLGKIGKKSCFLPGIWKNYRVKARKHDNYHVVTGGWIRSRRI